MAVSLPPRACYLKKEPAMLLPKGGFRYSHVCRQGFSERALKLHWPKLILTGKMQLFAHRGTVLASNKKRNVLSPLDLQQVHRHW